ncbi:MAG: hypothetical protein KKD31_00405 [Bacteroidetes bacterium]|nr:hypothetical protein [Bacteroidota bacterium]
MAFRNERFLHHRKSDFSSEPMISMYKADAPYVVYDQEEWWSDNWNPLDYGRDFDFKRPFFDQFKELQQKVPRMSLNVIGNENSTYTNFSLRNKDCYLIYTADFNEKCAYGRMGIKNYRSYDFDFMDNSRFCYECVDVYDCNQCFFCQNCENSSELIFCYNMQSSQNCMFCINLKNQEYCIFNKQVSKDEYEQKKGELLSSYTIFQVAKKRALELFRTAPRKYVQLLNCEDCTGDYLKNSRNSFNCYDSRDLEDCHYCSYLIESGDCYDWDFVGAKSELCYEMVSSAYQLQNCCFVMNSWENNSNLLYCDLTLGSQHCFGSVGLRHKKYCVFNKQYSKDEYEKLVPRIIEHMKETGEWGEFFPVSLSPFAYNETIAFTHHPLTRNEVQNRGWEWFDEDETSPDTEREYKIPDKLSEIDEDVTKKILKCEISSKKYKIIPQELKFYQEMGIPIPHRSPNQRHVDRINLRNPRKLWLRNCHSCQEAINTTYGSNRPEIVLCEACYLKEIY